MIPLNSVALANYIQAATGGLLVVISACLLLLFNRRHAGMNGIINGIITPAKDDFSWRLVFIISFFAGAILHHELISHEAYSSIQVSYSPFAFLSGLLFGVGLSISTMLDRHKIINFLDITSDWDPTLLFVMAGAVFVMVTFFRFIPARPAPGYDSIYHFFRRSCQDINNTCFC